MKLKGFIKTNYSLGGHKLWVYHRNPSVCGFKVGRKFMAFSGGQYLDPNEAAAQFMRLGLKDLAAAVSPKTPIGSLVRLASKEGEEIREAVENNLCRRGISGKDLKLLIGEEYDKAAAALKKLREKGIPEVEIMQLAAESSSKKIRLIAAASADTPDVSIFGLAEYQEPEVVIAAINNLRNRSCSEAKLAAVMEKISQSRSPEKRLIAASSPFTAKEVLSNLVIEGRSDRLVKAAIENLRQRNIPESEIMGLAARSSSSEMKLMAAASPATSKDILFRFIGGDWGVNRVAVIKNLIGRGIDEARVMEAAAGDSVDSEFALMAARSSNTPERALFDMLSRGGMNNWSNDAALITTARAAIENLIQRGHNEADIMKFMARSNICHKMQGIAAQSPATPVESLLHLVAVDGLAAEKAIDNLRKRGIDEALIMSHAVRNPSVSGRHFALNSDATPAEDLLNLIRGRYFQKTESSSSDEPDLILAGLRKRRVPEAEIMKAAGESIIIFTDKLRQIAAESPATPFETLLKLAGDENPEIAQAAIDNLTKRSSITAEKMKLFGESQDPQKRLIAAKSSLTPNDILYKLAKDKDLAVAQAAKKNLVSLVRLTD